MMETLIPAMVTVLLALLLAALIVALIVSRDFRDAVMGGPGEARILNLLTVKGVAIVLLSGLLIGAILFSLEKILPTLRPATGPIPMRLNIHFVPDEVNPRNPDFKAEAYLKTAEGSKPIPIVHQVSEGALSIKVTVPDMETPFFIVFETPKGTWKTDDYSVQETRAAARKQELE